MYFSILSNVSTTIFNIYFINLPIFRERILNNSECCVWQKNCSTIWKVHF